MDDFERFLEAGTIPEDWLPNNQRSIHSHSASSSFPPALDFAQPKFSQPQGGIIELIEPSDTTMSSPSPNMSAVKREESGPHDIASPQLGSMLAGGIASKSISPGPESQIDPLHQRSLQPSQPQLFRSIFGNSLSSSNNSASASASHPSTIANHYSHNHN